MGCLNYDRHKRALKQDNNPSCDGDLSNFDLEIHSTSHLPETPIGHSGGQDPARLPASHARLGDVGDVDAYVSACVPDFWLSLDVTRVQGVDPHHGGTATGNLQLPWEPLCGGVTARVRPRLR